MALAKNIVIPQSIECKIYRTTQTNHLFCMLSVSTLVSHRGRSREGGLNTEVHVSLHDIATGGLDFFLKSPKSVISSYDAIKI